MHYDSVTSPPSKDLQKSCTKTQANGSTREGTPERRKTAAERSSSVNGIPNHIFDETPDDYDRIYEAIIHETGKARLTPTSLECHSVMESFEVAIVFGPEDNTENVGCDFKEGRLEEARRRVAETKRLRTQRERHVVQGRRYFTQLVIVPMMTSPGSGRLTVHDCISICVNAMKVGDFLKTNIWE